MYPRSPFGSTSASPPTPSFRPDIFGQASPVAHGHFHANSPTMERYPADRNGVMPALSASTSDPLAFRPDARSPPTVMIRRLPHNISIDTLRSMLIFSNDLLGTELVRSPYTEDTGFATALARFQTAGGAVEAQQKLHGKPNTTKAANMIVEVHGGGAVSAFERRNTIDSTVPRTQTSSASSGDSAGAPPGRSRFGSAFQTTDKVSPPLPTSSSGGSGEFPVPENSAHFQNLFSPQSPLANGVDGHHRVSGKSMINNDCVDDETGELLKDPVAYAKSGQQPATRRTTNPHIPTARFAGLSLSTSNGDGNGVPPATNGFHSQRDNSMQQHHPWPSVGHGPVSSQGANTTTYLPNYSRTQYPPVNPADQNPPCNTLYVGNLPIDTSEDELKSLFSKQRGYKRLCFRTKQNGPMCFVEFEDVSFATKALHELYGHPLHNSVKGGIRLSFSKNPLGVRSGQTNGLGQNAVMSPQAMSPGYGGMASGGNFSSVSGPPPGLATPPGLMNGGGYRSPPPQPQSMLPVGGVEGMFANPFGMPPPDFVYQGGPVSQANSRSFSGGVPPNMGNGTYDGRDGRTNSYNREPRNEYNNHRKGHHDSRNGFGDGYHDYDYNTGR